MGKKVKLSSLPAHISQKVTFIGAPHKGSQRMVWREYQSMIPSSYNFSVSPTWAEIQATQG